ncbi:MAG: catecholate siderophore receptor Fiu [Gammaproteobacteria bacterium]|nr:catecholate siderophore receptor Fiu [Gammaproteobacteria bacterium]
MVALATLALPIVVTAQQRSEQVLAPVTVTTEGEPGYRVESSSNPKLTQPLVDTPQTITVINKEILREQGASTLVEALRNTPGITQQLGENGNTSAGDTFQLRAFSTQTATFVDGIRDLGAVTRDVFNLEQVEVAKGSVGADIGRGAASGYINLVSKLPTREDMLSGGATWNTANHKRLAVDLNRKLGETAGFRLNLMGQAGGVDGRDEIENNGFGIAPSFAFGLGTPTRFTLYSQHIRQDNVPEGGIPTIGMKGFYNANAALQAGARVDRENFYGSKFDYERIDADMVTAKVEHDLASATTLRNISRYGKTRMDRILTGVNTLAAVNALDPASWTVARTRQRVDQINEVLANQSNVTTDFTWGGIRHALSSGLEFIYERQKTPTFGTTTQTINGVGFTATLNPAANLYAPNEEDLLGMPYRTGAYTDGDTFTAAFYAFDTLDLSERWQLSGGLRAEHYRTNTDVSVLVTTNNRTLYPAYSVGQLAPESLSINDELLSWKVGVLFKPATIGSVYAAYANSFTPPGGGNFALSATNTNQNAPTMDPQETANLEFGTKWELLDRRLNVSGAIFRTENDKQVSFDLDTNGFAQFGKTRVDGVELAAVGQLTNFWQVSASIAKTRTKVRDQFNASGVETSTARWSPDVTANFWTSYSFGELTIGGGTRYVSKQKRVVTAGATTPQNMPTIPSYWVTDLMAAYAVTRNVNLRLNVYNLFDEDYIGTLNNSGARMTLGTPLSAAFTAEFIY